MDESIKKLLKAEENLERARKMIDWAESTKDTSGFVSARLSIRDALIEISSVRKMILKSSVTEQA